MFAVVVASGAVALQLGGSLSALAATSFRLMPLLIAGFALQLAVTFAPGEIDREIAVQVLIWANALVAAFVVANRALPGTTVMLAGLLLNITAIALNGGMPVSETAADIAGIESLEDPGAEHLVLEADARLPWLTDVIPIPKTAEVLSVGDLLLAFGMGRLVYVRTRFQGPASEPGGESR